MLKCYNIDPSQSPQRAILLSRVWIATYSIQDVASNGFTASAAANLCGEIEFTADLYYHVDSGSPDGPHTLSDTDPASTVSLTPNGSISISSDDISMLGLHEIRVNARLASYPAVAAVSTTVIPFSFVKCPVLVQPWAVEDFFVSSPGETII